MSGVSSFSASLVTNPTSRLPHHAIQCTEFLGFVPKGRPINVTLSWRFPVRTQVGVIQLFGLHRTKLKLKSFAFSVPKENDQAGLCDSGTCTGDEMPVPSENDENLKGPDEEIVSSVLVTEVDLLRTVEHLGNKGSVVEKLKAVYLHVLASEQWNASQLKLCHRNYLDSATNLIHYLALRCLDIQQLKEDLTLVGLMNLEIINLHVLSSLNASIRLLEALKSNSLNPKDSVSAEIFTEKRLDPQNDGKFTIQTMREKASSNSEFLLGRLQDGRTTHIMVTVGQEATENETFITDLIKAGTSIIRINCAHGNPSIWSEIIKRVKESSQMLEKPCRILMDLAGPKLRTGKLKSGPSVVKISPKKNASGNVVFPAQVWLSHREAGPPPTHLSPDAVLCFFLLVIRCLEAQSLTCRNRDFMSEDGPCSVKGTIGLPEAAMSLSLVSGVVGAVFTGAVDDDVTAIRFRESADCASSTTGLTMYLNR